MVEDYLNDYYSEGIAEYALALFPPDFKGICVDVGAYDPFWLNNSWIFEEDGWDVHCIEPNPSCIPKLKEFRKNVYEYACGSENKDDADFFVFTANEIVGEASGTGLIDFRLNVNPRRYYEERNSKHYKQIFSRQLKVNVRTLDWLMENKIKRDHIDYLSIDVEKYEMEVLKGTNLNKWKPKIIVIERTDEDRIQSDWLKSFNYRPIYRIVYNDVYIDEDFYQSNLVFNPLLGKMQYQHRGVE
jgi:FkbM family methyltransferase